MSPPKVNVCHQCGKHFRTSSALAMHVKSVRHVAVKPQKKRGWLVRLLIFLFGRKS